MRWAGLVARLVLLSPLLVLLFSTEAGTEDAPQVAPATLPEATFSGTGEAGTGTLGARFGWYEQPDEDEKGNPFLDEDLRVIETVFIADYNVNDRLKVHGLFSIDIVTSASIGRLDDYPEQTGASGDYYFGLDLGGSYELALDRRVGGFFAMSFERDYWSAGFGGSVSADFNAANTTVDLAGNYFGDTIEIIRFDGDQNEGTDDRHTVTLTGTVRQLLDPKSFGELGGTYTYQTGFLETAYNGVVIREEGTRPPFAFDNDADGFEIEEALPNSRHRGAVFGRVRRLLIDGTAVQLGGSYGIDDWDVRGYSVEPLLFQQLVPEVLNLRLRYRYYDQTKSEHYDITLDAEDDRPRYRTQDTDYSAYDAHTIGARFEWRRDENWLVDIGVDYTLRSDDLDFVFGSIGVRRAFIAPEDWWRESDAAVAR